MSRRIMLLAASVVAIALAAPVAAGATAKNLTHGGESLTGNAEITFSGTFATSSSAGGFVCPVSGKATLEPGTTGKLTEFKPTTTAGCTYSGNLDNLCGVVDTHASTGLPWTIHATLSSFQYLLEITGTHIDLGGTGIFCPDVTANGTMAFWVDNNDAIKNFSFRGTLASNLGTTLNVEGSGAISPAGTYGMEE